MTIIVPMAGFGHRFVHAGYADPKPLIKVDGKMMIEHVCDMFREPPDKFIFICNDLHAQQTNILNVLRTLKPGSKQSVMPNHKNGPVFTVSAAFENIPDDEPVIVSYCDGAIRFNQSAFENHVAKNALDGCLFTHAGFHPHTLSSTKMAFLRLDADGMVAEVKEKQSFTTNPMNEHASSGVYYFKSGKLLKHYFQKALDTGVGYNGECYVTLVYNLLIQDGLRVGFYDTDLVAILGTPEEVRNFEAWMTIARNKNLQSMSDVIGCYNYWRGYVS